MGDGSGKEGRKSRFALVRTFSGVEEILLRMDEGVLRQRRVKEELRVLFEQT